jgi:hypothetical protein
MAENGFKPPMRPKNALDNNKLNLSAVNSKGKRASLLWQLVNNNPRIVVYTNDPDDQIEYGKISAKIDAPTFFAFMNLIEAAINATGEYKAKIDNSNFSWSGGKRAETPTVESSLLAGKDTDGVVWVAVSAPRRPQIKFQFINPEFHSFVHKDGTPYEKAEMSVLMAKSYLDVLRLVMAGLLIKEYVEPKPKEERGGGGRPAAGGAGGGRGNFGGGQKPAAQDEAEDTPW